MASLTTFDVILMYRTYWEVKRKSYFHNIISLITSQEVSFQKGRQIRQKLYEIIKSDEFTKENIKNISDKDLITIGIKNSRIVCIREISELKIHNEETCIKIKGIGPWTIKAASILSSTSFDEAENTGIILYEDKWIRKRLSELVGCNKILTEKETISFFEANVKGHYTLLSYFLWRIKPSGVKKWKNGDILEREDFV